MKLLRFVALAGTLLIAVRAFAQTNSAHPRHSCHPTWVFLLHGIGQTAQGMDYFKRILIDELSNFPKNPATGQNYVVADSVPQNNLDSSVLANADFIIDDSFNFACATDPYCGAPGKQCEIHDGANLLASMIDRLLVDVPFAHVILIGYSMGGLVARDMITYATKGYFSDSNLLRHKITALVTLGTPNLGYPWAPADDPLGPPILGVCPVQMDLMGSDFVSGQDRDPRTVALSQTPNGVQLPRAWLNTMTSDWGHITWPSNWSDLYWEAISGSYCSTAVRAGAPDLYGCPDYNRLSDGVVCDESARFQPPASPRAVDYFTHQRYNWPPESADTFSNYGHTAGSILCATSSAPNVLFRPSQGDALTRLVSLVVGYHK